VNNNTLKGYAIELHKLTLEDLTQVFHWRNSPSVRQYMLNSALIDYDAHCQWFEHMLGCDKQLHYKIVYKDQAIGVINIRSNVCLSQATNAEIGVYIADEKFKGNLIAFSPSLLLIEHAFNSMKIKTLHSVVLADNHDALRYNQALGYQAKVNSSGQVDIELTREQFECSTKQIKAFLSRNK